MVHWRVRWQWYVVALGLPLLLGSLTTYLVVQVGAPAPSVERLASWPGIFIGFVIALPIPGLGGAWEEPGWQGYAQIGDTILPLQGRGDSKQCIVNYYRQRWWLEVSCPKRCAHLQLRMNRHDVAQMVKRYAQRVGLPESICCHTFRGAGITIALENESTLEEE